MSNIFSGQSITDFYQNARQRDFARKNLFRILSIEGGRAGGGIVFDQSDLVYVTTTSLPKRSINVVNVAYMGMKFNVPGTAQYPGSEAWTVKFRMPQDLTIRRKLEAWTRFTFDDATSKGAYSMGDLGTVTLALMDKKGTPSLVYRLVGAFCVNLGEYALDATDAGTIVEQDAVLAYQYWEYV
jgi:hypothetical protein